MTSEIKSDAAQISVKPLSPADVKESPAMLAEFANTVKIVNDHLSDGKREVNLGTALAPQTVKSVIKAFQDCGPIGWKVRRSVDKNNREVILHLSARKAPSGKKRASKKTTTPATAAPVPN